MLFWQGPLLTDGDLYIDNRLDSTSTKTGSVTVNTVAGQRLFIGGDNDTAPDRLFGIVDEIRLWDATMSAANLLERYDRELDPADEPEIVAYWRFELTAAAAPMPTNRDFPSRLQTENLLARRPADAAAVRGR